MSVHAMSAFLLPPSYLILALVAGAAVLGLALAEPADAPADRIEQAVEPAVGAGSSGSATPAAMPALAPPKPAESSMCLMIESAARANELPVEFFARVIWQESRFQAGAVGPLTRSGARAQGIAQFMPATATERGLLDPFDPVQALPKSAEYLKELRQEFGNLGLAAAAYNAGPRRLRDWLVGTGFMPRETRSYVAAITGRTVEDWSAARAKPQVATPPRAAPGCGELIALLKRAPNPFVAELEHRVVLGAAKAWGVQLAAGFSKDRALAAYARLMRRFANIVGEHDPSLTSTLLRSRGTHAFYQVRIGADTRAGADGLCGQIRRGGGACMVLRNARGSG